MIRRLQWDLPMWTKVCAFWTKACTWIKAHWQLVTAVIVTVFAAITVGLSSQHRESVSAAMSNVRDMYGRSNKKVRLAEDEYAKKTSAAAERHESAVRQADATHETGTVKLRERQIADEGQALKDIKADRKRVAKDLSKQLGLDRE